MQSEIPPAQTESSATPNSTTEFGDDHFEKILPPYLANTDKSRLKDGLEQFFSEHSSQEIKYDTFYKDDLDGYFKQADLIADIRFPDWDNLKQQFNALYSDCMLVSNTCDISPDNQRGTNLKQCLFAPVISFPEYLKDLKSGGYSDSQIRSFEAEVKRQKITNIFYLPSYEKDGPDFIVLLDGIFKFPTPELAQLLPHIAEEKIKSLSNFGFYLFVFNLSYHLCRLPETADR